MKKFPFIGVIVIVTSIFLLFIISTIQIRKELLKGEIESNRYIKQYNLLNQIRSSLAHLSMWQLTYTQKTDEREKYLSRRRMRKISNNIPLIIDSLKSLNNIDSLNISRLSISTDQLIEAHKQIINNESIDIKSVVVDSMQIDYRSIFDIVTFHLNAVQEISIHNEKRRSKDRYIGIIVLLVIEMSIIIIIALIVYIAIYARKRAEQKLLETEIYFNDVVNSMPSAIIGTDENGNILRINKTAFNLCQDLDWEGKPIEEIFSQLKNCKNDLKKHIKERTPSSIKEYFSNEYDENFVYDIKTYPLSSVDRKGAVIRIDDITIQENLEEQLRQTQKMNAIGQLAGGIAHDFNNTLGGILGAAEFINSGCSDDEKNEFLKMIINASNKASNLTRKLLTFARKNEQKKEIINIHDILNSSVILLEHSIGKKITISKNYKASSFLVNGDFSELQNMILNIGINADHAMTDGGAITITTDNFNLKDEFCKSLPFNIKSGEYIAIEISDTGKGISDENLKRIFEPFFTTKDHGTGIGLSSVYGTVQQHDGSISVSSKVNEGTTFTIYLPIEKNGKNKIAVNNSIMVPGEGTILIIDDEEMIRKSLKLILRKIGYKTLYAENGRAGIEVYKAHKDDIKLIILDMIMPVLDGKETLEELRKFDEKVPVILSSGYAHSDDIYRAKDLSIQGILPKPYSGAKLSKLISEIINSSNF